MSEINNFESDFSTWWGNSCEIVLRWVLLDLIDYESTWDKALPEQMLTQSSVATRPQRVDNLKITPLNNKTKVDATLIQGDDFL